MAQITNNIALWSVYIFFGLAPSVIWLLFYLRKDKHPEPNRMVIKIFLYGMISAVFAALTEIIITHLLNKTTNSGRPENYSFFLFVLYNFLAIALVEELAKYFVVRGAVFKNKELDEPVDIQLYMIISALGFAALENILLVLPLENPILPQIITKTITTSAVRFIGATFLHALCSGTLGYFLARAVCKTKKRNLLIFSGITIAFLLHGLYNFSIIKMFETNNTNFIIIPILILSFLASFVLYGFAKLNKIKSVCKI